MLRAPGAEDALPPGRSVQSPRPARALRPVGRNRHPSAGNLAVEGDFPLDGPGTRLEGGDSRRGEVFAIEA